MSNLSEKDHTQTSSPSSELVSRTCAGSTITPLTDICWSRHGVVRITNRWKDYRKKKTFNTKVLPELPQRKHSPVGMTPVWRAVCRTPSVGSWSWRNRRCTTPKRWPTSGRCSPRSSAVRIRSDRRWWWTGGTAGRRTSSTRASRCPGRNRSCPGCRRRSVSYLK